MLDELRRHHGVMGCVAVVKAANFRSVALLRSVGFTLGSPDQHRRQCDEPDEQVWVLASLASLHASMQA